MFDNYANYYVNTATPPIPASSNVISGGVMAGIIIGCIIAGIFLIVLTMVMFSK